LRNYFASIGANGALPEWILSGSILFIILPTLIAYLTEGNPIPPSTSALLQEFEERYHTPEELESKDENPIPEVVSRSNLASATIALRLMNSFLTIGGYSKPYRADVEEDINVMITFKCPFNCRHCFGTDAKKAGGNKDVGKEKLFAIFDQLKGLGKIHLVGTGEPLAYGKDNLFEKGVSRDFIEIVKYAASRVKEVRIVTNAYSVPEGFWEAKKFFAQFPRNVVWVVSADEFHEEEMLKRTGKSLGRIVRTMERLARWRIIKTAYNIRIPVRVKTRAEISKVLKRYGLRLKNLFDGKNVFINRVISQGNATNIPQARELRQSDMEKHKTNPRDFFPFITPEGHLVVSDHIAYMTPKERGWGRYNCGHPAIVGNVAEHSLAYLFLNRLLFGNFGRSIIYPLCDYIKDYKVTVKEVITAAFLYAAGRKDEAKALLKDLHPQDENRKKAITVAMAVLFSRVRGLNLKPFVSEWLRDENPEVALSVIDQSIPIALEESESRRRIIDGLSLFLLASTPLVPFTYFAIRKNTIMTIVTISIFLISSIGGILMQDHLRKASEFIYKRILKSYWKVRFARLFSQKRQHKPGSAIAHLIPILAIIAAGLIAVAPFLPQISAYAAKFLDWLASIGANGSLPWMVGITALLPVTVIFAILGMVKSNMPSGKRKPTKSDRTSSAGTPAEPAGRSSPIKCKPAKDIKAMIDDAIRDSDRDTLDSIVRELMDRPFGSAVKHLIHIYLFYHEDISLLGKIADYVDSKIFKATSSRADRCNKQALFDVLASYKIRFSKRLIRNRDEFHVAIFDPLKLKVNQLKAILCDLHEYRIYPLYYKGKRLLILDRREYTGAGGIVFTIELEVQRGKLRQSGHSHSKDSKVEPSPTDKEIARYMYRCGTQEFIIFINPNNEIELNIFDGVDWVLYEGDAKAVRELVEMGICVPDTSRSSPSGNGFILAPFIVPLAVISALVTGIVYLPEIIQSLYSYFASIGANGALPWMVGITALLPVILPVLGMVKSNMPSGKRKPTKPDRTSSASADATADKPAGKPIEGDQIVIGRTRRFEIDPAIYSEDLLTFYLGRFYPPGGVSPSTGDKRFLYFLFNYIAEGDNEGLARSAKGLIDALNLKRFEFLIKPKQAGTIRDYVEVYNRMVELRRKANIEETYFAGTVNMENIRQAKTVTSTLRYVADIAPTDEISIQLNYVADLIEYQALDYELDIHTARLQVTEEGWYFLNNNYLGKIERAPPGYLRLMADSCNGVIKIEASPSRSIGWEICEICGMKGDVKDIKERLMRWAVEKGLLDSSSTPQQSSGQTRTSLAKSERPLDRISALQKLSLSIRADNRLARPKSKVVFDSIKDENEYVSCAALKAMHSLLRADNTLATDKALRLILGKLKDGTAFITMAVLDLIPVFGEVNKASFTKDNLEFIESMFDDLDPNVKSAAKKARDIFIKVLTEANSSTSSLDSTRDSLRSPSGRKADDATPPADGKAPGTERKPRHGFILVPFIVPLAVIAALLIGIVSFPEIIQNLHNYFASIGANGALFLGLPFAFFGANLSWIHLLWLLPVAAVVGVLGFVWARNHNAHPEEYIPTATNQDEISTNLAKDRIRYIKVAIAIRSPWHEAVSKIGRNLSGSVGGIKTSLDLLKCYTTDEEIKAEIESLSKRLMTEYGVLERAHNEARDMAEGKVPLDYSRAEEWYGCLENMHLGIRRLENEYLRSVSGLILSIPAENRQEFAETNSVLIRTFSQLKNVLRQQIMFADGKIGGEIVDIDAMIKDLPAIISQLRGVEFHIEGEPLPPIKGNEQGITYMLVDLVNNAVKFAKMATQEAPQVTINKHRKGRFNIVAVSDNGPGMTEEQMARLGYGYSTTGSSGIGITESQLIVKDHGGTITVESKIGKGTTFTVRLPIAQAIPEGSVVRAFECIQSEFQGREFTLKEFQLKRINPKRNTPFSETTLRAELYRLVSLGILEVNKTGRSYQYRLSARYQRVIPEMQASIISHLKKLRARLSDENLAKVKTALDALIPEVSVAEESKETASATTASGHAQTCGVGILREGRETELPILSPIHLKILKAVEVLQKREKPVTQRSIAKKSGLSESTIANYKKTNPRVRKAIFDSLVNEAEDALNANDIATAVQYVDKLGKLISENPEISDGQERTIGELKRRISDLISKLDALRKRIMDGIVEASLRLRDLEPKINSIKWTDISEPLQITVFSDILIEEDIPDSLDALYRDILSIQNDIDEFNRTFGEDILSHRYIIKPFERLRNKSQALKRKLEKIDAQLKWAGKSDGYMLSSFLITLAVIAVLLIGIVSFPEIIQSLYSYFASIISTNGSLPWVIGITALLPVILPILGMVKSNMPSGKRKPTKPDRTSPAKLGADITIDRLYIGLKRVRYVGQHMFMVKDINVPLGTVGLYECRALLIIDHENAKHFLTHISIGTRVNEIKNIFNDGEVKEIDLTSDKTEIYVIQGANDSNITERICTALQDLGIKQERIWHVVSEKPTIWKMDGGNGIVSHKGNLYRPTLSVLATGAIGAFSMISGLLVGVITNILPVGILTACVAFVVVFRLVRGFLNLERTFLSKGKLIPRCKSTATTVEGEETHFATPPAETPAEDGRSLPADAQRNTHDSSTSLGTSTQRESTTSPEGNEGAGFAFMGLGATCGISAILVATGILLLHKIGRQFYHAGQFHALINKHPRLERVFSLLFARAYLPESIRKVIQHLIALHIDVRGEMSIPPSGKKRTRETNKARSSFTDRKEYRSPETQGAVDTILEKVIKSGIDNFSNLQADRRLYHDLASIVDGDEQLKRRFRFIQQAMKEAKIEGIIEALNITRDVDRVAKQLRMTRQQIDNYAQTSDRLRKVLKRVREETNARSPKPGIKLTPLTIVMAAAAATLVTVASLAPYILVFLEGLWHYFVSIGSNGSLPWVGLGVALVLTIPFFMSWFAKSGLPSGRETSPAAGRELREGPLGGEAPNGPNGLGDGPAEGPAGRRAIIDPRGDKIAQVNGIVASKLSQRSLSRKGIEMAIEGLKDIYILDPKNKKTLYNLAHAYVKLYMKTKRNVFLSEALRYAKKSIHHHPDYAGGYYMEARAYEMQEEYEKVIESCERGLEKQPENKVLLHQIARTLTLGTKDYRRAIGICKALLKEDSRQKGAISFYLYASQKALGMFDDATETCKNALEAETKRRKRSRTKRDRIRLWRERLEELERLKAERSTGSDLPVGQYPDSLQPGGGMGGLSELSSARVAREELINFILKGDVKRKSVDEKEARALADVFDRELKGHNLAILSRLSKIAKVISQNTDFGYVISYSMPGLYLVYFTDMFDVRSSRFMLLDDKEVMVGYGTSSRETDKVRFKFRIFPEYRNQGKGGFFLKLILYTLYREDLGLGTSEFIFPKLTSFYSRKTAESVFKTGLPQFLIKRGFVPRGDTTDLTKCDFVFTLDASASSPADLPCINPLFLGLTLASLTVVDLRWLVVAVLVAFTGYFVTKDGGSLPLERTSVTTGKGDRDALRFREPFDLASQALRNPILKKLIVDVLTFNYGQFGIEPQFVANLIETTGSFQGSSLADLQAHLQAKGIDFKGARFQRAYSDYKKRGKAAPLMEIAGGFILDKGTFIDIGAGGVFFPNEVARRFKNIERCIAYETPEFEYKPTPNDLEPRVEWLQGELMVEADGRVRGYRIPVEDKSVTTAFMHGVLHHIPTEGLVFFFDEIARILKDGGRLIILEDGCIDDVVWGDIKVCHPDNTQLTDRYLSLSLQEQIMFLRYIDFHGNVIVGGHQDFDFPFGFRNIELWQQIIEQYGFQRVPQTPAYSGFVKGRFHQPPVGILAFDRLPLKVVVPRRQGQKVLCETAVLLPQDVDFHHWLNVAMIEEGDRNGYTIEFTPVQLQRRKTTFPTKADSPRPRDVVARYFASLSHPALSLLGSDVVRTNINDSTQAAAVMLEVARKVQSQVIQGLWRYPFGQEYGTFKQWVRTRYRAGYTASTDSLSNGDNASDTVGQVTTFGQMGAKLRESGDKFVVVVPVADSGSVLQAIALLPEQFGAILIGNEQKIRAKIKKKNLAKMLRPKNVSIVHIPDIEDTPDKAACFAAAFECIREGKAHILLKGNTKSNELMDAAKEALRVPGQFITHMRILENKLNGRLIIMTDGGINVLSNKPADKRKQIQEHIVGNGIRVACLLGTESPLAVYLGSSEYTDSLERMLSCQWVNVLVFPWIGPANIIYKACEKDLMHWGGLQYCMDVKLTSGKLSIFRKGESGKCLIIATPKKGAGLEAKEKLLNSAVMASAVKKPRVALLDFTEETERFEDVPSIQQAIELKQRLRNAACIIEGPMSYDIAVSKKAAEVKSFVPNGQPSKIAGQPDILFMPDYDSGKMLETIYKNWAKLNLPWTAADISYGGAVPILIPSRSDSSGHKARSILTAAYLLMREKEEAGTQDINPVDGILNRVRAKLETLKAIAAQEDVSNRSVHRSARRLFNSARRLYIRHNLWQHDPQLYAELLTTGLKKAALRAYGINERLLIEKYEAQAEISQIEVVEAIFNPLDVPQNFIFRGSVYALGIVINDYLSQRFFLLPDKGQYNELRQAIIGILQSQIVYFSACVRNWRMKIRDRISRYLPTGQRGFKDGFVSCQLLLFILSGMGVHLGMNKDKNETNTPQKTEKRQDKKDSDYRSLGDATSPADARDNTHDARRESATSPATRVELALGGLAFSLFGFKFDFVHIVLGTLITLVVSGVVAAILLPRLRRPSIGELRRMKLGPKEQGARRRIKKDIIDELDGLAKDVAKARNKIEKLMNGMKLANRLEEILRILQLQKLKKREDLKQGLLKFYSSIKEGNVIRSTMRRQKSAFKKQARTLRKQSFARTDFIGALKRAANNDFPFLYPADRDRIIQRNARKIKVGRRVTKVLLLTAIAVITLVGLIFLSSYWNEIKAYLGFQPEDKPAPTAPAANATRTPLLQKPDWKAAQPVADSDEVKRPQGGTGLIGKWMPTTEVKFEPNPGRDDGYIVFKAKDIEHLDRDAIEIKLRARRAAPEAFDNFRRTDIEEIDRALEEFLYNFVYKPKGDTLILKPNQYGIHGIGNKNIIAVRESLRFSKIPKTHEIMHAAIDASALPLQTIVNNIRGGEEAFREYVSKKPHRQIPDMRIHYALRLLLRQRRPLRDKLLTRFIRTIQPVRNFLESRVYAALTIVARTGLFGVACYFCVSRMGLNYLSGIIMVSAAAIIFVDLTTQLELPDWLSRLFERKPAEISTIGVIRIGKFEGFEITKGQVADLLSFELKKDASYFIAMDGKEAVGIIGFKIDERMLKGFDLWVSPDRRGRAVGRRLILKVADLARKEGIEKLTFEAKEAKPLPEEQEPVFGVTEAKQLPKSEIIDLFENIAEKDLRTVAEIEEPEGEEEIFFIHIALPAKEEKKERKMFMGVFLAALLNFTAISGPPHYQPNIHERPGALWSIVVVIATILALGYAVISILRKNKALKVYAKYKIVRYSFTIKGAKVKQGMYEVLGYPFEEILPIEILPIVKVSINGKVYKVGRGRFIVITLANGKKIYWGGEHNLSYSFFFEHYREKAQGIIDRGGVVWRHLDAHWDFKDPMNTPSEDKHIDWQEEVRIGHTKVSHYRYLNRVIEKGIASRIDMGRNTFTIQPKILKREPISITTYHLKKLADQDIEGGVCDLDIDIVAGAEHNIKEREARERFENMKPHIVSIAQRSDVCFFINSSELSALPLSCGTPNYIDPDLAVRFNGELIQELAQRAVNEGKERTPVGEDVAETDPENRIGSRPKRGIAVAHLMPALAVIAAGLVAAVMGAGGVLSWETIAILATFAPLFIAIVSNIAEPGTPPAEEDDINIKTAKSYPKKPSILYTISPEAVAMEGALSRRNLRDIKKGYRVSDRTLRKLNERINLYKDLRCQDVIGKLMEPLDKTIGIFRGNVMAGFFHDPAQREDLIGLNVITVTKARSPYTAVFALRHEADHARGRDEDSVILRDAEFVDALEKHLSKDEFDLFAEDLRKIEIDPRAKDGRFRKYYLTVLSEINRKSAEAGTQRRQLAVRVYRDKNGVRRIDLDSVPSGPGKSILQAVKRKKLEGKIFLFGGITRDILLGIEPIDFDYLTLDKGIDGEKVGHCLWASLGIRGRALTSRRRPRGTRDTFDFTEPDLSIDRIMLGFDEESEDPFIDDPQGGYEDLLHRRARLVGNITPLKLYEMIPGILKEIDVNNLIPTPETYKTLNDFIHGYEKTLCQLPKGETPTSRDKELLSGYHGWKQAFARKHPTIPPSVLPPVSARVEAEGVARRVAEGKPAAQAAQPEPKQYTSDKVLISDIIDGLAEKPTYRVSSTMEDLPEILCILATKFLALGRAIGVKVCPARKVCAQLMLIDSELSPLPEFGLSISQDTYRKLDEIVRMKLKGKSEGLVCEYHGMQLYLEIEENGDIVIISPASLSEDMNERLHRLLEKEGIETDVKARGEVKTPATPYKRMGGTVLGWLIILGAYLGISSVAQAVGNVAAGIGEVGAKAVGAEGAAAMATKVGLWSALLHSPISWIMGGVLVAGIVVSWAIYPGKAMGKVREGIVWIYQRWVLRVVRKILELLSGKGERIIAAIPGGRKRDELRMSWLGPKEELSRREVARIRALAEELRGVIPQLWAKEGRYWGSPEISPWLGWTSLPEEMEREVRGIEKFARMVGEDYESIVVIGEGAGLYAKVGANIGKKKKGYPELYVLESTHPEAVRGVGSKINLKETVFVVSSPGLAYEHFYGELTEIYRRQGISSEEIESQVGKHFVAIVEANTPFAEEAREREFLETFNVPEGILALLALAGVNIKRFVKSVEKGMEMCREENPEENPGVQLALFLEAMRRAEKQIVLALPEELRGFGEWWKALVSGLEIEGKEIIPIVGEELSSPESYGENTAFIAVRLDGTLKSARPVFGRSPFRVTAKLREAGYPVFEITLAGEEAIGELFYVAGFATALSGYLGVSSESLTKRSETFVSHSREKGVSSESLTRKGEPLSEYPIEPEIVKYKGTKVFVFDFVSLFEIEPVREATPSRMSIELKVRPKSRAVFKIMERIVRAAEEVGNLGGVKFAFVSSRRDVSREVMEQMLRDYMSGYGLSAEVVARVIDNNFIVDERELREVGGIVGIPRTPKISTRVVFSIINERLLLTGKTDGNGTEIKIITDREARWEKDGKREMMERILWVVLNPAKEGEVLSTAAGLVVAIEGKVSEWLIEFINRRYSKEEAVRLSSQIEKGNTIILPATPVDEKYLEGIKAEERIYKVQA